MSTGNNTKPAPSMATASAGVAPQMGVRPSTIKVEFRNGNGGGIFWQGRAARISDIANPRARKLAEKVVRDGQARSDGDWHVSGS